jgi:hypothetical protein
MTFWMPDQVRHDVTALLGQPFDFALKIKISQIAPRPVKIDLPSLIDLMNSYDACSLF